MSIVETTQEQFAQFETEVRRLWAVLGMTGWDLYVLHEGLDENIAARCTSDGVARRITISLNTKPNDDKIDVKQLARHEVGHEDELTAAEHEVVMRLLALLERL